MLLKFARILILIALLPMHVRAQIYYDVPSPFTSTPLVTSSVTVVGLTVTVKPINGPNLFSGCNTGPFWIGAGFAPNGFMYVFSEPVPRVRVQFTNVGDGEIIRIEANGQMYTVQPNNLSDYAGSCVLARSAAINGKIGSLVSNSGAQFDLDLGVPLDSVLIYHENGIKTGSHYTFSFLGNPKVNIGAPFNDTLMCQRDTVTMSYSAIANFDANNVFQLELSDANGSFAAPVVLGSTPASAGNGFISGRLPGNAAMSNKYRLRVSSTSPVRYSADNGFDISINPYPAVQATSNSPVCAGESITMSGTAEAGTIFSWSGPDGFSDTAQQVTIANTTSRNSGSYYATADLFTCKSYDTVEVRIKPLPVLTNLSSNTPVCAGDSIVLKANSDLDSTSYIWYGPKGSAEGNPALVKNTDPSFSGTYILSAKAFGCTSLPASIQVNVKPLPELQTVTNNGPLYVGDTLILSGYSPTPDVTYKWTGPEGFTATEAKATVGPAIERGDNMYTLTVMRDGCDISAKTYVQVYPIELFLLYPNPNYGTINLKVNMKGTKTIPIDIVNILGQVVQRESANVESGLLRKTFELRSDLPTGRYFLRLATGKRTEDIKFELLR